MLFRFKENLIYYSMNILHLTHTDILSDSRILKEMAYLSTTYPSAKILGLGICLEEEKHKTEDQKIFELKSFILHSKKFIFLPKVLRHALTFLELFVKMFFSAWSHKPTIIHCHDTLILPLGWFIKLFSGAKLIYDAHELESNKNGQTKILQKLTLWIEKCCWSLIDGLIVVSPSIENWYKQNFKKNRKIKTTIIFNSPELKVQQESKYDTNYLREKFSIPHNKKVYIYIGILGKGRSIELLLDVFGREDVVDHIVFLGYGELEDSIRNSGDNIHLHEAVEHALVVPIAQNADFGFCLVQNVSLSDYYCLPNKLFEYAFSGLPVLASNFPDISKLVEEYQLGECIELNVETIVSTVNGLHKVESTRVDTTKLYPLSWSAQGEKLGKLYKELLCKGAE